MMNVAAATAAASSAYSGSRCDSGWTLYLQHSSPFSPSHPFLSNHPENITSLHHHVNHDDYDVNHDDYDVNHDDDEEEEEEDLSMVSDASSGPPHFHHHLHLDLEDDEVAPRSVKRKPQCIRYKPHEPHDFGLDDTASSPFIFPSITKNGDSTNHVEEENQGSSSLDSLMDYSSQAFSATHFKVRSAHSQEHYGFVHPAYSPHPLRPNQWR